MQEALGLWGAVAVAILLMLGIWLMSFWLIAELGGWSSLARNFTAKQEPSGERFSWTSAKCNFFSTYNNCMTVTVSTEGIDVRPMPLFRWRHAPLFFPWEVIAVMRPRPEMFRYSTFLEVSTPDGVHPVTVYGRPLAEALTRYAPDRLLGPRHDA